MHTVRVEFKFTNMLQVDEWLARFEFENGSCLTRIEKERLDSGLAITQNRDFLGYHMQIIVTRPGPSAETITEAVPS